MNPDSLLSNCDIQVGGITWYRVIEKQEIQFTSETKDFVLLVFVNDSGVVWYAYSKDYQFSYTTAIAGDNIYEKIEKGMNCAVAYAKSLSDKYPNQFREDEQKSDNFLKSDMQDLLDQISADELRGELCHTAAEQSRILGRTLFDHEISVGSYSTFEAGACLDWWSEDSTKHLRWVSANEFENGFLILCCYTRGRWEEQTIHLKRRGWLEEVLRFATGMS